MATAEVPARAHGVLLILLFSNKDNTWANFSCHMIDRHGLRRPFSSWMKRLANLKNSSSESNSIRWSNKLHTAPKGKKSSRSRQNNPYPLSGTTDGLRDYNSDTNDDSPGASVIEVNGHRSRSHSEPSLACSGYENQIPATSAKSTAPTISTNGDTSYSKAGTLATAGGGISSSGGGEGSTFSSPAPSVRSLTTTLTTVQSAAPSAHLHNAQNVYQGIPYVNSTQNNNNQQVQFTHQFPSSPASAVPPHLAPHHGYYNTYHTATANGMLTDNASILTLASSSKRRRRNSLDTNASVRALAPSSVYGGSRESLPLSVLSSQVNEPSNASAFNASSSVLNRPSMVGLASADRVSIYSSGVLSNTNERGSLYATKQGDGASIRSAAYSHHGRNESNAASISGVTSASVNQPMATGRISRRSSGWGEINEDEVVGDESDDEKGVEKKESDEKIETKTQIST
ncbi:hypothetical protein SI65_03187 [Aspergillus cristatus]|uniref:Uncharacterized protein n=1 Tax=Aspergillus cristatus TaxID=573508 RepID=A0A1E3BNG7_ASPCR|nr:hypothetical protein SI65_03187 [Aspergillus cristatus]